MDRHELNQMFDGLEPDPRRERELLRQLLQDDVRRKVPMKNWKRIVVGVAAAALLITGTAAAVPGISQKLTGISQKLMEYFGVAPEDSKAVELLAPGAVAVDVSVEDNGMVFHVTQVLRESRSILVLADFTAPEGTVLDYTEKDQLYSMLSSVFPGYDESAGLLDKNGRRIDSGPQLSGAMWKVVDDDHLSDNHLTLVFRMEFDPDSAYIREAVSLRLPSPKLYRYTLGELVDTYPGDWACVVPVPQADARWVLPLGRVIGELDGAAITVRELYLTPVTLNITLERSPAATVSVDRYGAVIDEEEEAAFVRWSSLGDDVKGITLTTKDGRTVPVWLYTSDIIAREGGKWWSYRLEEATDPAEFQGGTLTLDWPCGKVTIPLDDLTPVEP